MKRRYAVPLFLVLAAFSLVACKPPAAVLDPETGKVISTGTGNYIASELSDRLSYFEDVSTGLCYAVYSSSADSTPRLFTNVPCDRLEGKTLKFESRWRTDTTGK